ncbi:MAG: hypothetical protein LBI42_15700 [Chitinispirillales bacterium]|jgi:hypothetical protein|nr:hypothetical protein [Chitinispirillales bacterium]
MKRIMAVTVSIFFVLAGCEDFSTSHQNIDSGEFRMLNFMFNPAEAAPGDSITLVAVFAGKKKNVEDIDWRISFNVMVDNYGGETAIGSEPLSVYGRILDISFSENTQTIAYKFKVPENVVRKSASIPENWIEMVPAHIRSVIPSQFAAVRKNELIDSIEYYANQSVIPSNFDRYLPILLQFFTVPVLITANINGEGREHKIQSSHSVRYNRYFPDIAPVNNNPEVDSILVYKVKGENIISFDNKKGKSYETIKYDKSKTLVISVQDGYTYFLEAFTSPLDLTTTMDAAFMGAPRWNLPEEHVSYWQFQMDKEKSKGISLSKQMDINNMFGRLIPPVNKNIEHFTMWLTVKDELFNERFRPRGSTLMEIQGKFEYR